MRSIYLMLSVAISLCACTTNQATQTQTAVRSNNQITILADEKVYIEAVIKDNSFVSLQRVESTVDPNITLTLNFTKLEGGNGMVLSVKNPFDSSIKYNLDMVDFKGDLHQTSSCPVLPKLSVFETWPHPIPELRISNIHFMAESDSHVCIY